MQNIDSICEMVVKHKKIFSFLTIQAQKRSDALHFVDLEKAYDRVPRQELWSHRRKSRVTKKYVRVAQGTSKDSVQQLREIKVSSGIGSEPLLI